QEGVDHPSRRGARRHAFFARGGSAQLRRGLFADADQGRARRTRGGRSRVRQADHRGRVGPPTTDRHRTSDGGSLGDELGGGTRHGDGDGWPGNVPARSSGTIRADPANRRSGSATHRRRGLRGGHGPVARASLQTGRPRFGAARSGNARRARRLRGSRPRVGFHGRGSTRHGSGAGLKGATAGGGCYFVRAIRTSTGSAFQPFLYLFVIGKAREEITWQPEPSSGSTMPRDMGSSPRRTAARTSSCITRTSPATAS